MEAHIAKCGGSGHSPQPGSQVPLPRGLQAPWCPRIFCCLLFPQDVLISSPQLSLFSPRGWVTMVGQWARALFLAKGSLKSPSSLSLHLAGHSLWALLFKGLVPRDRDLCPHPAPTRRQCCALARSAGSGVTALSTYYLVTLTFTPCK